MDIGTIHSIWTIVLFICFIGVVWWAYGKSVKRVLMKLQTSSSPMKSKIPRKQGVTK